METTTVVLLAAAVLLLLLLAPRADAFAQAKGRGCPATHPHAGWGHNEAKCCKTRVNKFCIP